MLRRTLPAIAVLALATGALAAPAMAPTDVIKARQQHYKEIGGAFKGVRDELSKPDPSVPAIQGYAARLNALAPQIPSWFPKGTGPEAGVKTAAKAEIWSDGAGFRKAADGFASATRNFDAAAKSGDLGAIKAATPALGLGCKTCHEAYRARES